jgi:hypothetical protein
MYLRVAVDVDVHLEPVLAPVIRDPQALVANQRRLRPERLTQDEAAVRINGTAK